MSNLILIIHLKTSEYLETMKKTSIKRGNSRPLELIKTPPSQFNIRRSDSIVVRRSRKSCKLFFWLLRWSEGNFGFTVLLNSLPHFVIVWVIVFWLFFWMLTNEKVLFFSVYVNFLNLDLALICWRCIKWNSVLFIWRRILVVLLEKSTFVLFPLLKLSKRSIFVLFALKSFFRDRSL